jgi:hypothetical protein
MAKATVKLKKGASTTTQTVDLPFTYDESIYVGTDWDQVQCTFYSDTNATSVVNFASSTFTGELLDKPGGTKLFDLTFNTPSNDGQILPKLTDTQTATLTGTTTFYFVTVTDSGGLVHPYFSGRLIVSDKFTGGA